MIFFSQNIMMLSQRESNFREVLMTSLRQEMEERPENARRLVEDTPER